ncbi:response regulator transcription factor [Bacillus smithii]|uniref:response regulator transcription factor n=1 Tax=Bacillus smithii TaxID=1479 RepID=UPI0022E64BDE|nr:response regulator transcription factor [Bacillus smithii]
MKRILFIEDDHVIAEVQKDYLEANGFSVDIASSGNKGLQMALNGAYDLILLDLMLPHTDEFEICRQVRKVLNIPILIVSAKKEDVDKIRGLGMGADDYIIKPFSLGELVARVKAHLSRFERLVGSVERKTEEIRIRGIVIDKRSRKVFVNGKEVLLTSKEYDLLLLFVTHPNQVFSKEQIFERIWGMDSLGDMVTVTVHVSKLREKIELDPTNPQYIQTIWGVGYRFNL